MTDKPTVKVHVPGPSCRGPEFFKQRAITPILTEHPAAFDAAMLDVGEHVRDVLRETRRAGYRPVMVKIDIRVETTT